MVRNSPDTDVENTGRMKWEPTDPNSTQDLQLNEDGNIGVETLGVDRDALFILYRGWEWSFKLQSEHVKSAEKQEVNTENDLSVDWDYSPNGLEIGGEAVFVSGAATNGLEMERSYSLQSVHPQNPETRSVYRQSRGDKAELVTDGGSVTVPADKAHDPVGFQFTTPDGYTFEMEAVDFDGPYEDTRVNGKPGGRVTYLSVEGEYNGPAGEGVYSLRVQVSQERGSNQAEIKLWIPEPFTENGEDELIELESATVDAE